ncbi:DUF4198 domain-containing protein [Hymenobacter pini]|uniref:DUF4198 domain-containing protein n=1 Tax=Hymenobacter pini TaxID=2880879 RepID=UPI001CF5AD71|nr:DUF4198 domain-containing protein [Hymenobacter pini]MCA8829284.1 DUF4198 domain-containing protein [Hymenobacter pini]
MRKAAFVLLSLGVTTTALAQQFWLEPARFWVAPDAAVHIRRLMGDGFQGTPWAGKSRRVVDLWHCAPGLPTRSMLPAATAADTLSTTFTLQQPGTHLLALTTDNAFSTFSGPDFTRYLKQENLQYIAAQRALTGDTTKSVREAYRRCAKTMVQVGPAVAHDTARAWSRVLNQPLELVPEQNPYLLLPGASLTIRVLRHGRPVAGQPVVLWRRYRGIVIRQNQLYSNQNGRLLFRLSDPGDYLASTVRMELASKAASADWQSTWSTLSFALADKKQH